MRTCLCLAVMSVLGLCGCGEEAVAGAGQGAAAGSGGDVNGEMTGANPFGNPVLQDGGPPDLGPAPVGPDRCETVKLDLLFVVDNSGSMAQEQEALAREFPRLVRALTSGDLDGDGVEDFPPVNDLQLGVVSTDMGIGGIVGIPGCDDAGDDGLLRSAGGGLAGCQPQYPLFLRYDGNNTTPDAVASDFACVADLGTDGCGFEQQLEAPLKALWPSADQSLTFVGASSVPDSHLGHGDRFNQGFLRLSTPQDPVILGIVVVTDEEDCSAVDPSHFTPGGLLDPSDPRATQDLNLRCFLNKGNLHPVTRYVNALRKLRGDDERLVVFAGIIGVPPDLVNAQAFARVDFTDPVSRENFYQGLLADQRMQEAIDPNRPSGSGSLLPSCTTDTGVAYPPVRLVETARAFGAQGTIQSICQSDFGPAIAVINDSIAATIRQICVLE